MRPYRCAALLATCAACRRSQALSCTPLPAGTKLRVPGVREEQGGHDIVTLWGQGEGAVLST